MLQSAADGNSAVEQGVVLEQVAVEAEVGRQQQQFDGEWGGSERAKNVLE